MICVTCVDLFLVLPFQDKADNWITPVTKILLQMCGFRVTKLPSPSLTFGRIVCVTHPVKLRLRLQASE